jgi:hypothetical protein
MDDGTTPTLLRRHLGVGARVSAVTAVLTSIALAAVILLVLLAFRGA